MPPGPRPFPVRTLHPAFVTAVHAARRDGRQQWVLSNLAGFPQQTRLSDILTTGRVKATPLNLRRLRLVAEALEYEGDVFVNDGEAR